MNYIGIDPGLDGAAVLLDADGRVLSVQDTPVLTVKKGKGTRRVYVESAMATILAGFLETGRVVACVENVHSMPKQGVTSMFSMGMGFGIWLGAVAALRIPCTRVEPRSWKKAMGIATGAAKSASIVRAAQLFPGTSFRRDRGRVDTLDGRADALLIAEHLRRTAPR